MQARTYDLKGGETLVVHEAGKADAARMLEYVNAVAGETDFLLFGEGELGLSLAEEEALLENSRSLPNQIFLLAEIEGELIGALGFQGGMRPRSRHVGEFGMSVARRRWGLGVGSRLIENLIAWAAVSGVVRKINLRARQDNERAIGLYERLGFAREGQVSREFLVEGVFYDAIIMGLTIGE